LGVLALHFTRPRRFSTDEIAAATSLASVVATAWEQATQREVISHQAMHDGLTGLANRALFLNRLDLALSRRPVGAADADQQGVAVMLIDLDGFKAINDTLGHHAGDAVLVSAAQRFRDAVRPQDTVARLGGDEFAVLCEQTPDSHAAARVARRVQAAAAGEPLVMDGAVVTVSASVGLALAKLPVPVGTDAGSLLREADTALYTAKQQGRARFQLFDEGLQVLARRRLELESELRQALDSGQFLLHYQPIRDTVDHRVLGVEALVRWNHPSAGCSCPRTSSPMPSGPASSFPSGSGC
jgi:diguanylate cyclase (GGDEF)-like protein